MKLVGIAAYSGEPSKHLVEKTISFIDALHRFCGNGIALILGGYWGLMKIVVDRALSKGITTIILPPLSRENMSFPDKAITLRLGVDYRIRSIFIARSCDVLVALGGEAGTLLEIIAGYCEAKPLFVLRSGLSTDKIELFSPYIDSRAISRVRIYEDPTQLAKDVCRELELKTQDTT